MASSPYRNLHRAVVGLLMAAAFAAGFMATRRYGRRDQARPAGREPLVDQAEQQPKLTVPTPTNAAELASTLALADSLYRQQDVDVAIAHYTAAAKYAHAGVRTSIKAALACEAGGRTRDALRHLLSALDAAPDHPEAHYQAARMLANLGRGAYRQAHGQAQRAKELGYPVPDELWQQLEELRQENERAKREGRPTPDRPLAGMAGRPGDPHLPQRPR